VTGPENSTYEGTYFLKLYGVICYDIDFKTHRIYNDNIRTAVTFNF